LDTFSKKKRSSIMRAVRSRGNKSTDIVFRKALKKAGITGWRSGLRMKYSPDYVFPKKRIAIFLDGCFWHGCKQHLRLPKTNRAYWKKKIASNAARDKLALTELKRGGWKVIRFWEHSITNRDALASSLAELSKKISRKKTL